MGLGKDEEEGLTWHGDIGLGNAENKGLDFENYMGVILVELCAISIGGGLHSWTTNPIKN